MSFTNFEIKARCNSPDVVRKLLKERGASFKGVDRQIDTYFNVSAGRMKLREGNIEKSLIYYERQNEPGPKRSDVNVYQQTESSALKEILTRSVGVLVVVEKSREIYFCGNVKFHIDAVEGLGTFVEIEAIDFDGTVGQEMLRRQCQEFMDLFGIRSRDLVSCSYSDMLLHRTGSTGEPGPKQT